MHYTIYLKKTCPYCQQAMKLLKKHGHTYTIIDVLDHGGIDYVISDLKQKKLLPRNSQHRTVPIIFGPNGNFIGGYTDIHSLLKDAN